MSDLTIPTPSGLPGFDDGRNGAKIREIEQAAARLSMKGEIAKDVRQGVLGGGICVRYFTCGWTSKANKQTLHACISRSSVDIDDFSRFEGRLLARQPI